MVRVRSTLFALLVLGGSAGVVHAQATQPAPNAPSRRDAMKAGRGRGHGERGLLRGIQLSDAEKASLTTIHEKYNTQFKSLRDSFKPQRDEFRGARERGDTAAATAIWEKSAAQREQMRTLRSQEQDAVRAALTPEHRQQFDKNVAELKQRMDQRVGKARQRNGASVNARGGRRGER